ncbi:hypothetical protein F444_11001 [Phytophthora nicotianae P1976]|uniref:Uncharacterized protein n=1 Tax=Phytophthora nicotianae P1976 TaxID=1317066 RepID=A0A081A2B0_PHYNI|nr:hypothetical protein F444_11001 [Phytophthora nicotianae P1976]
MVELAHFKSEMVKMREELSHAFEAALKRHINGSVMTIEALEAAFSSVLARSNLVQHNLHLVQSPLDNTNATCIDQSNGVRSELILWDSTFHRVAKDFVLPSGTVRVVWQQWCGGQPPLRLLTKHDMSSRLKKVRLSELRRVMLLIEALLTQEELKRAHSSSDAAGLLFEQIKGRLPFASSSGKGRSRKLDQLSWRTLAHELKALHN